MEQQPDPWPDPRPGHYYVTAIDGNRAYFLAGPWPEHAQALAQVEAFAERTDYPRAVWMAFGTARMPIGTVPKKSALGSDPQKWSVE